MTWITKRCSTCGKEYTGDGDYTGTRCCLACGATSSSKRNVKWIPKRCSTCGEEYTGDGDFTGTACCLSCTSTIRIIGTSNRGLTEAHALLTPPTSAQGTTSTDSSAQRAVSTRIELIQCPHCPAMVRVDRLERQVSKVHLKGSEAEEHNNTATVKRLDTGNVQDQERRYRSSADRRGAFRERHRPWSGPSYDDHWSPW
jgi:hypothetical protein